MERMLYVAMSGARQAMLAQAAHANNLANANTTAFRADLNSFRSMPLFGPGLPSRVYAMDERPGVDFTPGTIGRTGRDLDIAIDGEGWIAVQAADGTEAYTRAGNLHLGPGGRLLTAGGRPVLGADGPLAVPPYEKLEIGADGTVSVRGLGQAANTLTVVDRIKLVRPPVEDLVRGEDGLFRLRNGLAAEPDASVRVVAGALEQSNVNSIEAMVSMLTLQRSFELQVKLMQAAEQNEERTTELMRLG